MSRGFHMGGAGESGGVMNPLIPAMTSNTTPSGECIGNSYYQPNWKAFSGLYSDYTLHQDGASGIIGYKFDSPKAPKLISFYVQHNSTGSYSRTYSIQKSSDGSTWYTIESGTTTVSNATYPEKIEIPLSTEKATYFRIFFSQGITNADYIFRMVQLYG